MADPSFLKKASSAGLALILIAICAVFVLQFGGNQAMGCSSKGATYAAKVRGDTINVGELNAAFSLVSRSMPDTSDLVGQKRKVLNALVDRTLLAQEARKLGFHVTDSDIWERIRDDGTLLVTPMRAGLISSKQSGRWKNEKGEFDVERVREFIQYQLHRSVPEFAESQIEEELAMRMRTLIGTTADLSPAEVWDAFVRERDRVRIKYVRFPRAFYTERAAPTSEELDTWIRANQEAVDKEYDLNKHRYTGLEKQVRARHILARVAPEAPEAEKTAARRRIDGLLARIRRGEDFGSVARDASDDHATARSGGDMGFNPRGRWPAAFDDAQFSLGVGSISDVIETSMGFHIVKVEGTREGDVPAEEAKRELSERLYRAERARGLAEEAAKEMLTQAQSGKTIDEALAVVVPPPALSAVAPEDPLTPTVEESRAFGRTDPPIPGAGELAHQAFELTTETPWPSSPVRVGDDFVVLHLEEREEAKREDFTDPTELRIRSELQYVKQEEALTQYVHSLRKQAEADGAIRILEEALEPPKRQ